MTHTSVAGRGWAYAGAILGGAVSIAANVAHSYVPPTDAPDGWSPHAGAVIGTVFWPVALFVAIEILARTAWRPGRRWVAVRYLGLLPVALVAAVVSYRHLSGLLGFYGEDWLTVAIGPLAVDGLMVMATAALLATGTRRAAQAAGEAVSLPVGTGSDTAPATVADTSPDIGADTSPDIGADTSPDIGADIRPDTTGDNPADRPADTGPDIPRTRTRTPRRTSRPDTATAVVRLRERDPDMTPADMARRLKVSVRTVRRHLATGTPPAPTPDTPTPAAPLVPASAA